MASVSLIGVHGHLGSGKDTLAARLVQVHGYVQVGFADSLKLEVAQKLRRTLRAYLLESGCGGNPLTWSESYTKAAFEAMEPTLDQRIHELLWNRRTPFARALLQEFGTEIRRGDDPAYWVWQWRKVAIPLLEQGQALVTSDVRFPNEVEAIRSLGGLLIRIVRPGFEGDTHQSEQNLAGVSWDCVILNSGSVEDLWAATDRFVEEGRCHQPVSPDASES